MSATITVTDERPAARQKNTFTLDFLESTITAREFLRRRIYQEVQDHNTAQHAPYNGLITPSEVETTLNQRNEPKAPRQIDWEAQYARALEGFQKNAFVMLWNDRQVESLDEELKLTEGSNATFLKLVPLVGG
jgi:hypothetical protein